MESTSKEKSKPAWSSYAGQKPTTFKIILVVAMIVVLGCGVVAGVRLTNQEAANQESQSSLPTAQVTITSGAFSPATIQVKKGQGVVWANEDEQPHMLAIDVGDSEQPRDMSDTGQINQGESYEYVFNQAGTFNYYDATNPLRFKGVVIVE